MIYKFKKEMIFKFKKEKTQTSNIEEICDHFFISDGSEVCLVVIILKSIHKYHKCCENYIKEAEVVT